MPEQPSSPDSGGHTGAGTSRAPDPGTPPGTPRWVKVSAIVVIGLVLLFVILHLTGNSPVGMGGHAPLLQHWMLQP